MKRVTVKNPVQEDFYCKKLKHRDSQRKKRRDTED